MLQIIGLNLGEILAPKNAGHNIPKQTGTNNRAQASLQRDGLADSHPGEAQLSKLDVVLTFNIEVIVMEVRGLRNLAPTREIYCTMEIEGSETGRLQTEHVQAKKPLWDTQGDFLTNHPLPILKIKLYAVNPSMLSLEDKELGKLVLHPTVLSPKTPEWCTMQASTSGDKVAANDKLAGVVGSSALGGAAGHESPPSGLGGATGGASLTTGGALEGQPNEQALKIRVIVRMDRPQQLKHCGFLYGLGKSAWRKFKRRYHVLIQVSQYTFVMCDFRDKKSKPTEMLPLEGYTVDYIEPPTELIMEHCSEITSNETSSSSSGGHHHHSTFGLAGRLAKPFLRSSNQSSSNSSSSAANLDSGLSAFGGSSSGCNPSLSLAGEPSLDSGEQSAAHQHHQQHQQHQQAPSAIQTAAALSDELHNKFYFNVVKEGDSVVFACDDEQECFGWVMALYRATGQAHKPTPLKSQYGASSGGHYIDAAFAYNAAASGQQTSKLVGSSQVVSSLLNGGSKKSGGRSSSAVDVADQRARKHGMDEFISADPCKFQHNHLFRYLQTETLHYRLNDQFCSFGWLSCGQLFVLDEYCARYGVRTCFRHLVYLDSLLDFNQKGYFVDHTLLNYGYDFCASFVSGNSGQVNPMSSVNCDLRPDGIGTVTVEERDLFHQVKTKLLKMIERQIANFSDCFPFGKPDGALKAALSLLERVHMKEHQSNSMVQNEEVRALIRKCLEQAALNHYTKLSGRANLLRPDLLAELRSNPTTRPVSSPTSASFSSATDSPRASPGAGSPLPLECGSPELQQQAGGAPSATSAAGQLVDQLIQGARKRTQSTLSSSSWTSGSQSSSAQSQSAAANSAEGRRFEPNGSLKRYTPKEQQSQMQTQTQSPSVQTQQQQQQANQDQCLTMAMVINNEHMRPAEKLRYLVVLAELCCEQVEENNEYFSDAFAWHSDLMMEHFELFWSLFSVDMDKILAELNAATSGNSATGSVSNLSLASQSSLMSPIDKAMQMASSSRSPSGQRQSLVSLGGGPSGPEAMGAANRDAFSLFQVINNHMRKSENFQCRKFKEHLCEIFKPKLLRYLDFMEASLARQLARACEKDGQVNCQLVEQMFAKLIELQRFVLLQLRWPDEQLAEQLHQRLKLIAYELCDATCQKTLHAFQSLERRSNKWTATTTSYSSPVEMIQMINLTLDTRSRSLKLCTFNGVDQMSYHSKIDKLIETALGEMQPGLMGKMLNALDSTLNKLARYDEGNLLAPIFSLTTKQGMSSSGKDIGKQYIQFVSNCCDLLRHKINDELWIITLLEDWYSTQMNTICNWLSERLDHSLHEVQISALGQIMPKIYKDMSLQGLEEEKLDLKTYQVIMSRLRMEEAALSASQPGESASQSGSGAPTSAAASTSSQLEQSQSIRSASSIRMGAPASGSGSVSSAGSGGPLGGGSGGGSVRRTFGSSGIQAQQLAGLNGSQNAEAEENGDNIADRALQSATRMFKGFWAS